jgi:hypothetical protein
MGQMVKDLLFSDTQFLGYFPGSQFLLLQEIDSLLPQGLQVLFERFLFHGQWLISEKNCASSTLICS